MDKPFLSTAEQCDLLTERGLTIANRANAERILGDTNYYRVSGYARQFQRDPQRGDNVFEVEISLERVQEIMALDDELRLLLFEALSIVEVAIRSRFAHEAGRAHGHRAFYLEPESYLGITPDLHKHISKLSAELMRPKQVTIARYRSGEDLSKVPIWVAIELVTFGMLARMVQYFQSPAAAKETAHSFSLPWTGFQSTVHSFAVLRNVCAHHGQLWHRRADIVAPVLGKDKRHEPKVANNSVYQTIIALKRYVRALDSQSSWPARIDGLLARDSAYADGIYWPVPR